MDEDTEAAALAQLELERRFFDEAQQALKDDAESFEKWLDELLRQGFEETRNG